VSRWGILALCGLLGACRPDDGLDPDPGALRLPTGAALSPNGDWLFVTNGNWDRLEDSSTVMAIDIARLDTELADAGAPGDELTQKQPCREATPGGRIECDPRAFIEVDETVRVGSGAGNIAIDQPNEEQGPLRLLVPSRIEPGLAWIDVSGAAGDDAKLDCGQSGDRFCDEDHVMRLSDDPANIAVDQFGFRFAYLPHLLEDEECGGDECAGVTLIGLDGEFGPEVVDREQDFFRLDPLFESGLRGGFSVAQRACDLESGNASSESSNCTRPVLYASQRFWPGIRRFRVAPGLDVILDSGESAIVGTNPEAAAPRPLMGDLEFEDPQTGQRLLIVHTTPPGLARVDTSIGSNKTPVDSLMQSVPVCQNPNMLAVHRPDGEEHLAFVSCYGDDAVAVVALGSFSLFKTIGLGNGPNEMVIDRERKRLYVVNTLESSISIVSLDRGSIHFLDEVAVLGLGSER
jgi:hypothetical protein